MLGTRRCISRGGSKFRTHNAQKNIVIISNFRINFLLSWNPKCWYDITLPRQRNKIVSESGSLQFIDLLNNLFYGRSFILNFAGRGDEHRNLFD